MPAINWTFLCDYAFADSAGRASIIRTFTFIRASKLPFRYPQLFLALEYMADRSETFTLGDSFGLSNFERSFTPIAMVHHPETDFVSARNGEPILTSEGYVDKSGY